MSRGHFSKMLAFLASALLVRSLLRVFISFFSFQSGGSGLVSWSAPNHHFFSAICRQASLWLFLSHSFLIVWWSRRERSAGVAPGNWKEECWFRTAAEENGRGSSPGARKQTGSPGTTYSWVALECTVALEHFKGSETLWKRNPPCMEVGKGNAKAPFLD